MKSKFYTLNIASKMKYLLFVFFLICFYTSAQGLKFTPKERLEEFNLFDTETLGFGSDIPSSYSLEKYVPEVVSQTGGTCVGYSSLYYGLSTMYNMRFNITSSREKLAHAFDPNFIYSIIQNQNETCEEGLMMYEAIELIGKIGAKKLWFSPFLNCNSNWNEDKFNSIIDFTIPYKIEDFYVINLDTPKLISNMKELISLNYPLIAGFSFVESMYPFSADNPLGVSSTGLWTPKSYETIEGGHAMCIIGYDDYKFGGAFRVVNSWGKEYGDHGYLWVKYSDIDKFVSELYLMELGENTKNYNHSKQLTAQEYIRLKLDNINYEGQYKYNRYNGLGILTLKDKNAYIIGNFTNSSMDGNLMLIDDDGIFSMYAKDGEILEIESLGFADTEEQNKSNKNLSDHISSTGLNYSLRKANSTKLSEIDF